MSGRSRKHIDDGEDDDDETGMKPFAEQLLYLGVACLPIPKFSTADRLEKARAQLDIEISAFPEFNAEYVRKGALAGPGEIAVGEDEDDVGAASAMTVKDLKAELKTRNLKVSGTKSELMARLQGVPQKGGAAVKRARGGASASGPPPPNKRELIKGGFSALNNPSSFHNEFVRNTRTILHPYVKSLMQALVKLPEFVAKRRDAPHFKFCQEIDRLMIRPIGVVPTSESWHRDSSPRALREDIVFGGWLNLDLSPQTFTCVLHFYSTRHMRSKRRHDTISRAFKS